MFVKWSWPTSMRIINQFVVLVLRGLPRSVYALGETCIPRSADWAYTDLTADVLRYACLAVDITQGVDCPLHKTVHRPSYWRPHLPPAHAHLNCHFMTVSHT